MLILWEMLLRFSWKLFPSQFLKRKIMRKKKLNKSYKIIILDILFNFPEMGEMDEMRSYVTSFLKRKTRKYV